MVAKQPHVLKPQRTDFRRSKLVIKTWANFYYVAIQAGFTNKQEHIKTAKTNRASSEYSDQPAHPRILISLRYAFYGQLNSSDGQRR